MQVTKLEHSGLAFSKNHQTLLFDPVEITEKLPTFSNVVGIVITHLHGDHFQPKVLQSILAENPDATLVLASESPDSQKPKSLIPERRSESVTLISSFLVAMITLRLFRVKFLVPTSEL